MGAATASAASAKVAKAAMATDLGKSAPAKAQATDEPALDDEPSAKTRQRASGNGADASSPLNPRQACGSRTFISLAICMKRHCSRPAYAGHAECKRMTEQEQNQHSSFP